MKRDKRQKMLQTRRLKHLIWGFVAMVVGLIITSLAGLLGSNLVKTSDKETTM